MIYLLIYIAVGITFVCGWVIRNERLLRKKNTELYEEKVQERAIQAEQVAGLVSEAEYQLHQYKTYVIRSFRTDIGYGCIVFSNDMKTKIGNTLTIGKSREAAVKDAEDWIDEWVINRNRGV